MSAAQQGRERKINEALQASHQPALNAEGARLIRVNSAKGDVARFSALLAEYQKAPDVTCRQLYLETMRSILPTVGQGYGFDADQPSSLLAFLDLKRGNGMPLTTPQAKE